MASESKTRWYDPKTCEAVDQVPNAKGDKMIDCTLTQARKLGFLPSVTSVLKLMASFTLQEWIVDNTIKTCAANPFDGDDVDAYIPLIKAKSSEYTNETADRGKALHGQVERYYDQELDTSDPVANNIIDELNGHFSKHNITNIECERGFASKRLGYAGTPDITGECSKFIHILDLKTTNLEKFRKPYDSWKLQLGGYFGFKEEIGKMPKLWQVVADRDTGETKIMEHDDPMAYFKGFINLCELFYLVKGYDPRVK